MRQCRVWPCGHAFPRDLRRARNEFRQHLPLATKVEATVHVQRIRRETTNRGQPAMLGREMEIARMVLVGRQACAQSHPQKEQNPQASERSPKGCCPPSPRTHSSDLDRPLVSSRTIRGKDQESLCLFLECPTVIRST